MGEVVDLVAERLESVNSAGGRHYLAAGFGEVEAELAAETRGSAGDQDHLALQVLPWLEVVRDLACHQCGSESPEKVGTSF